MMMKRKNKIRLHRDLHIQTTPHPDAGKWLKRGLIVASLLIIAAIIIYTRPNDQTAEENLGPKNILGEQDRADTENFEIHTVKAGDTLFTISQLYNTPWEKIAEINNLKEPYTLRIGREIKIPQN